MSTTLARSFPQLTRIGWSLIRNRLNFRGPTMMMHAVTEACNARCPFCVFRHGKRRPDELTLPEITALYRDSRANGIQYVHLWGGEPLVHPQIEGILAAAREAGLFTGMVTNGALLSRRAELVTPLLERLYISLDHPSNQHDALRKTPGLFRKIVEGITRVRTLSPNKFILLNFTLMRDNADAVSEMAELAKALSVRLYINPMRTTSNAVEKSSDRTNDGVFKVDNGELALPWEDQRPIWRQVLALKRAGYPIQNARWYMRYVARHGRPPPYRCHWPKICLMVDANGDVVDCQRWEQPITNIREVGVKDLIGHPRMTALFGEDGESCNACVTPTRVEPSKLWGLHPGTITQLVTGLVLKKPIPPARQITLRDE